MPTEQCGLCRFWKLKERGRIAGIYCANPNGPHCGAFMAPDEKCSCFAWRPEKRKYYKEANYGT